MKKTKKRKVISQVRRKKKRPAKKSKVIKKKPVKFDLGDKYIYKSKIRIIGIGGGGGSIVNEIASRLKRVSFVAANTDAQALRQISPRIKRFQFGKDLTKGLGCGMDPGLGRLAAQKEKERIAKLFEGYDLCILIASLGGGTGSGAIQVFAEVLKEQKKNCLGVFTLPFKFEGEKKAQIAKVAIGKLAPVLSALTIFPNEKIFQSIDRKTPLRQAFSSINKSLADGLEGLVEMVYLPGLINIDFADLKMILGDSGKIAYLNSVKTAGPNRAEEAVKKVLYNPLSEYNIRIEESDKSPCSHLVPERILFNITASKDLKMKEVAQISKTISDYNRQAKLIFGVSCDKNYQDKLRITLLAIGEKKEQKKFERVIRIVKKIKEPILLPIPTPPVSVLPEPDLQVKAKQESAGVKKITKKKEKMNRKTKKQSKPKPKPKILKKTDKVSVQNNNFFPAPAEKPRRNALDLKKQAEKIEQEMLALEKKWDIPAFLRKRNESN
jgi:cell division protein FtsZ